MKHTQNLYHDAPETPETSSRHQEEVQESIYGSYLSILLLALTPESSYRFLHVHEIRYIPPLLYVYRKLLFLWHMQEFILFLVFWLYRS